MQRLFVLLDTKLLLIERSRLKEVGTIYWQWLLFINYLET